MEWQEFYNDVGSRIRACRKSQNISQKDLAERINKTYACVSKYERGEISIDVFTLYEIADVLGVDPQYLLPTRDQSRERASLRENLLPIFQHKRLWCYHLSEQKTPITSCMEINLDAARATMYMNLRDPLDPMSYHYIMPGSITAEGPNIKMYFTNPMVKGDFIGIYFDRIRLCINQNVGISASMTKNYQVRITKYFLSPTPIKDRELLGEMLTISKEELSYAKKNGCLLF